MKLSTNQNAHHKKRPKSLSESPSAVLLRKQECFIHAGLWKIGQLYVDYIIVGQIIAILRKTWIHFLVFNQPI